MVMLSVLSLFLPKVANTSDIGVLSTVYKPLSNDVNRDWELAVIVYNSNDTSNKTSLDNVNISVSDLPTDKELMFAVYSLDNNNGNPYELWKKQGSPVFPTDNQLRELRNHQVLTWNLIVNLVSLCMTFVINNQIFRYSEQGSQTAK